mmetsp:Transcript_24669/g.58704  ORF Transcript_24669/g.58704 Transcript_24669/m.58704 type:complete len:379 (+) Transcript_24669:1084-2220(+)
MPAAQPTLGHPWRHEEAPSASPFASALHGRGCTCSPSSYPGGRSSSRTALAWETGSCGAEHHRDAGPSRDAGLARDPFHCHSAAGHGRHTSQPVQLAPDWKRSAQQQQQQHWAHCRGLQMLQVSSVCPRLRFPRRDFPLGHPGCPPCLESCCCLRRQRCYRRPYHSESDQISPARCLQTDGQLQQGLEICRGLLCFPLWMECHHQVLPQILHACCPPLGRCSHYGCAYPMHSSARFPLLTQAWGCLCLRMAMLQLTCHPHKRLPQSRAHLLEPSLAEQDCQDPRGHGLSMHHSHSHCCPHFHCSLCLHFLLHSHARSASSCCRCYRCAPQHAVHGGPGYHLLHYHHCPSPCCLSHCPLLQEHCLLWTLEPRPHIWSPH